MKNILIGLLALVLIGCGNNPVMAPEEPEAVSVGHMRTVYPMPDSLGGYYLEIHYTADTLRVDLASFKEWTADSLGKAVFKDRSTVWSLKDGKCLFAPAKLDCMDVF